MALSSKQLSSAGWLVVDDPKAADYLTTPESVRFLKPFFLRERSASEAALAIHVAVDTMLYRVKTMLELGLIEQTSLEARRGRPIKRYRTVSDHFVIPFESTKAETVTALMRAQQDPKRQQILRGLTAAMAGGMGGWMVQVFADERSQTVRTRITPDDQFEWTPQDSLAPQAPAAWFTTLNVHLTHDEAKSLQQELAALYEKYRAFNRSRPQPEPQHRLYVMQLGFAKTAPSDEPEY